MNLSSHAVASSIFFIMYIISMPARALENIEIHHELQSNSSNSVTLTLHIHNHGDTDLTNVKLIPSGNEFSVETKNKTINIGHLPSQGESIIQWSATTPVSADYFKTGMPVFFQLTAKHSANDVFNLSLYSRGEK